MFISIVHKSVFFEVIYASNHYNILQQLIPSISYVLHEGFLFLVQSPT